MAGHRVGQGQGQVEQGGVEAQGIAGGTELHRATQQLLVAGGMQGRPVGEADPRRAYGHAQQVLHHGQQRGQAELAVEHRQFRRVAVAAGHQARLDAVLFQAQLEVGAQQCRMGQGEGQGIAQGAAGEHGVAEDAVGRDVHAQAEGQAEGRVPGAGQGIGEDAQFLGMADQLVGGVEVRAGDVAALQQAFAGDAAAGQGRHGRGDGVQGGECALFR
ncbi:hypothetical protein D9M70_546100 [compost metagenome]